MPKTRKRVEAQNVGQQAIQTEPPQVIEKAYLIDTAKLKRQGSDLNPEPHDVYQEAASLVQREKMAYEDANRALKETIRRCYKNYVGVFDQPNDPYTGRPKIFTLLTHNIVDSVAKPVSVSAKSIKIKPITNESRGKAKILNMILPYFFQQMGFDQMMKQFVHRVTWFGGWITVQDWLYEEHEEASNNDATTKIELGMPEQEAAKTGTKKVKNDRPRIRMVNILDVFCPATGESLEWMVKNASIILRSTATLSDVQGNPAYNAEARANLSGKTYTTVDRNDSTSINQYAMSGYSLGMKRSSDGMGEEKILNPQVTIYERYGRIPKSWITGDTKDDLTMVPGIITCASDENGLVLKTLNVRLSPFGDYGPFEDARFNILPNRYLGEGIAERLIPLQTWHNEVVNNRRNNELYNQHGMFKYKKGTGIDPRQFFARPGGGIAVENMGDVEFLNKPPLDPSTFNEDALIESAAQRSAGAATTPIQKKVTATESANIQANSNVTYNELRDTIEKYLERLVLNHLIPLLKRYFRSKKMIPVELPVTELEMLDTFNGYPPFMSKEIGQERFIYLDDPSVFDGEFAVTVDIEAEAAKPQQIAALNNMLALASKIQNSGVNIPATFRKISELSGIVDDRLFDGSTSAIPTGVTNPQQMPQPEPSMAVPQVAPNPAM